MKPIEGCGLDQFDLPMRISRIPAQVQRNEFRPVSQRHVHGARGPDRCRIVRLRSWLHRSAHGGMPPGFINRTTLSRRAEPATGNAERFEQPFLHQFFPRPSGDLLDHCAHNGVTGI